MKKKIQILVIGVGSIGKRHIRNLKKIGISANNILAIDTRKDRLDEVRSLGVKKCFSSINQVKKEEFDAAIICSPTSLHVKQCLWLAKRKKHLLIEKPLSHNSKDLIKLKKAIVNNKIVTMIAYIFRFHPGVILTKKILDKNQIGKKLYFRGEFSEYLPDWHPYENYRKFYMAKKKQGGGSILDQCHIMDLSHFLMGEFKDIVCLNTKKSKLDINADDISELIVNNKNGSISSIHTDIFGRKHSKYFEIKAEKGNLRWDFYKNTLEVYFSKNKKIKIYKFRKDFNLSYIDEIKHFIDCVLKRKLKTKIPYDVGFSTMKLINAAEASYKTGKRRLIK